MADENILLYEQRDDVAWLTMNRPRVRNALSREHVAAIREGVERASAADEIRVIVLAGSDPVFCAGADVNQYREASEREQVMADGALLYDLLDYMLSSPKPIIARVQKAAFGGAVGLIAACDLAVAAEGTRFALSEARLGLVPAVISHAVLDSLGPRATRSIMLKPAPFDAEEALRLGLIHQIAPEDELHDVIDHWVSEIRAGAPGALADVKRLLRTMTHQRPSPEEQRSMILSLAGDRRADPEGQEGMRAFLEKRRPSWNPERE